MKLDKILEIFKTTLQAFAAYSIKNAIACKLCLFKLFYPIYLYLYTLKIFPGLTFKLPLLDRKNKIIIDSLCTSVMIK